MWKGGLYRKGLYKEEGRSKKSMKHKAELTLCVHMFMWTHVLLLVCKIQAIELIAR